MLQWIKYFLVGIEQTATKSVETLSSVLKLKEKTEKFIRQKYGKRSTNAIVLLQNLFRNPFITIDKVAKICDVSYKAANDLVKIMQEDNILKNTTGQNRNRIFVFDSYLSLFETNH